MSKWLLAAGAAAIALTSPSLADPGGNKGKGGGDHAQKAERGGGGKHAQADRGGGGKHANAERHGGGKQAKIERRGGGEVRFAQGEDRGKGYDKIRGRGSDDVKVRNGNSRGHDRVVIRDRDRDNIDVVRIRDGDRRLVRFDDDFRGVRGLIDGCPPGLAKKGNGCLPPGQAKKLIGTALPLGLRASLLDGPYRQWYRDDDRYYYRDDGDYIYRVRRDGGLIDALFPFADRDYSYYPVGMSYPLDYNYYNVPYQYRTFYPDGDDYLYRYGDGAIYAVDPSTYRVNSIVALLAGDLAVGQPLPVNYGVYNVPLAYRERYYDTPEAIYRYNDGYIYRADPATQLITAVIQALV